MFTNMTCSTIEGSSSSQPSTILAGRDVNPKIPRGHTYPSGRGGGTLAIEKPHRQRPPAQLEAGFFSFGRFSRAEFFSPEAGCVAARAVAFSRSPLSHHGDGRGHRLQPAGRRPRGRLAG